MKLEQEAAKIFEREFAKVIKKEIEEQSFLPQRDFKSCRGRAEAGVKIAMEPVIDMIALTIAKHREENHKDNTFDEQATLLTRMDQSDIDVSVRSFWNH